MTIQIKNNNSIYSGIQLLRNDQLPGDLVSAIFDYLSPADIARLMKTCKKNYVVLSNPAVWNNLMTKMWVIFKNSVYVDPSNISSFTIDNYKPDVQARKVQAVIGKLVFFQASLTDYECKGAHAYWPNEASDFKLAVSNGIIYKFEPNSFFRFQGDYFSGTKHQYDVGCNSALAVDHLDGIVAVQTKDAFLGESSIFFITEDGSELPVLPLNNQNNAQLLKVFKNDGRMICAYFTQNQILDANSNHRVLLDLTDIPNLQVQKNIVYSLHANTLKIWAITNKGIIPYFLENFTAASCLIRVLDGDKICIFTKDLISLHLQLYDTEIKAATNFEFSLGEMIEMVDVAAYGNMLFVAALTKTGSQIIGYTLAKKDPFYCFTLGRQSEMESEEDVRIQELFIDDKKLIARVFRPSLPGPGLRVLNYNHLFIPVCLRKEHSSITSGKEEEASSIQEDESDSHEESSSSNLCRLL